MTRSEICGSIKLGATVYVVLLLFSFVGPDIGFGFLQPVADALQYPTLVFSHFILKVLTGESRLALAGPAENLASVLNLAVCILGAGVFTWIRGRRVSSDPAYRPAQRPDSPRTVIVGAFKWGLAIAVVLLFVAPMVRSTALVPFCLPGVWLASQLFPQPGVGTPGMWLGLGTGMNATVFAGLVLLVRFVALAWRHRQ
jgi:hypothetical protein